MTPEILTKLQAVYSKARESMDPRVAADFPAEITEENYCETGSAMQLYSNHILTVAIDPPFDRRMYQLATVYGLFGMVVRSVASEGSIGWQNAVLGIIDVRLKGLN